MNGSRQDNAFVCVNNLLSSISLCFIPALLWCMCVCANVFSIHSLFSSDFDDSKTNLHVLDAAIDHLEKNVWHNIEEIFVYVEEEPAILIRTLEVIEMEDRAVMKLFRDRNEEEEPASVVCAIVRHCL